MILQVEDKKVITDTFGDANSTVAMNVGQPSGDRGGHYGKQYQFKGRRSREEMMSLYCTHCQRNGHDDKECFKLHGYPDWYMKLKEARGKNKANFAEKSTLFGLVYDKPDARPGNSGGTSDIGKLIQSELAKYMSTFMFANARNASSKFDVNMVHGDASVQPEFGGHYAFSILNGRQRDHWIIDSGASTHICCNSALMASVTHLPTPQVIHLPDGSIQKVDHHGTAVINDDITLPNVLLAPSFTHNLISIAQLSKETSAKVLFFSTHCLIQNRVNDHVLGMGRLCDNLYI